MLTVIFCHLVKIPIYTFGRLGKPIGLQVKGLRGQRLVDGQEG